MISGISARRVSGSQIVASGNGAPNESSNGIIADTVRIDQLTAQHNLGPGVSAQHMRLQNSTVTENNGLGIGVDLASSSRPRLRETTCGRSQKFGSVAGDDWDVCLND